MGQRVDMKVVFLGKEYSGKTSVVTRFLKESFNGPASNDEQDSKVYQAVSQHDPHEYHLTLFSQLFK